jgi:hypothetical protein
MKRTSILLKRIDKTDKLEGKIVIGVIGTHKGAGVTHIAILLANYLNKWVGKQTAYIEYGVQNEIVYLQEEYENNMDRQFKLHGVTYYKNVHEKDMGTIMCGNYQCIILDLGTDLNKGRNEFLRSDKKIIIGSNSQWKKYELQKFLNGVHPDKEGAFTYILPFAKGKEISNLMKEYNETFYSFPFEPNPFVISAKTVETLQKIF